MPSTGAVITWKGDAWMRAVIPSLNRGLTAAVTVMADQAVRNFGTEGGGVRGSGSRIDVQTGKFLGQLRRKRARSRDYIAAPPGKFPGVRTSLLRNSVRGVSPERMGTPLHAAFGTAVKYGRYLEFGWIPSRAIDVRTQASLDRGLARVPARPWIRRSAMQAAKPAEAAFVKVAGASLKAAGLVQ